MGNQHNGVNIEKAFPNLMEYQRKEILKNCTFYFTSHLFVIVTKSELSLLYLLYQSLKSRSLSDGIDKEAFHHFCEMPVSYDIEYD